MNEVYALWHHSCDASECTFDLRAGETCPSCGEGEPQYISVLKKDFDRLVEYERATRNTICWGVHCVHEAAALDLAAEADARRESAFAVLRLAAQRGCRRGEDEVDVGMINCNEEDCLACRARRVLWEKS